MAKALIGGMNGIQAKLEKHIKNAINKGTEVLGDPHATSSDYRDAIDYVEQEFKNACQETGTTASDAARDEFEEHVLKGLSKEDFERWFEHKARAVKDLAEKARNAAPKVENAAKVGWLQFVGVVSAIFTGVLIFSYAHSGPTPEQKAAINLIRRTEMEQQQMQRLSQF